MTGEGKPLGASPPALYEEEVKYEQRLSLARVLLGLRDYFFNLLPLRIAGIAFQQFFPRNHCARGIVLALPFDDSHVEEGSGMIRTNLQ